MMYRLSMVTSIEKMRSSLTYSARLAIFKESRRFIEMGRVVPELDQDTSEAIIDQSLNPKRLFTRRNMGMIDMPARLRVVAEDKVRSTADNDFRNEASLLIKILSNFKLPDDKESLKAKKSDIKTKFELRGQIDPDVDRDLSCSSFDEQQRFASRKLSRLILGTLAQERRDWHYYNYDQRASIMYMAARLAPNYSSIKTVMNEIRDLDPDFSPRSVLDFGSGLGTVQWAISETWPDSVSEFMNIDISKEQQYLSESLLRAGNEYGEVPPGIFHKQYLPVSNKVRYNMVVSAYSLLELPSRQLRANVVENLWHKTNDFLVLIERGNKGGFTAINEARSFILDLSGHDVTKKINMTVETKPVFKYTLPDCHIFSPCSHEFFCPRDDMPTKMDRDVCRFRTFYTPLCMGSRKPGTLLEDFSYVVLRKGPHPSYLQQDAKIRWPRIVEKRDKANSQVTHKLCCPNGCLAATTITKKKYGKAAYEVAKSCDWGDMLPVKVCDDYVVKNSKLIAAK